MQSRACRRSIPPSVGRVRPALSSSSALKSELKSSRTPLRACRSSLLLWLGLRPSPSSNRTQRALPSGSSGRSRLASLDKGQRAGRADASQRSLPFYLFASSRQEILRRHVPLEEAAPCSAPAAEKEVGEEAAEAEEVEEEDMYHLKRLHLAPPPVAEKEEEEEEEEVKGRYCPERDNYTNCYNDIGKFIYDAGGNLFSSVTLPAATKQLDATTVLVAFKTEEPVLKILQPGVGKWVEHRYADDHCGWAFHDVCAFEGRLYAVTTHGKMAEVELAGDGGVKVGELLESERYEEEKVSTIGKVWTIGKVVQHIFDVLTDTESHVLHVAADGRGIRKVIVYWRSELERLCFPPPPFSEGQLSL